MARRCRAALSGGSGNAFRYTGREDDATGLYYYRARYYHPGLQRFISEDPLDFSGGDANLFNYVRNIPTQLRDPLGLFTIVSDCDSPRVLSGRKDEGSRDDAASGCGIMAPMYAGPAGAKGPRRTPGGRIVRQPISDVPHPKGGQWPAVNPTNPNLPPGMDWKWGGHAQSSPRAAGAIGPATPERAKGIDFLGGSSQDPPAPLGLQASGWLPVAHVSRRVDRGKNPAVISTW